MSKIILKNVYLLNWYGFVDKTIPLGDGLSLITGENECGKSTILDAIKYAFTGDTDFNKATSATRMGSGKRTLSSYTRCLIDPDSKKYARSSTDFPNVYTHIAMEYFNQSDEKYFVLGVILETNPSDNVDNFWYSIENITLKDVKFFNEADGKKYVLNSKQFREKNKVELLNKSNGIVKFMNMTGLKLQGESITNYQRKLKNIMTYNPEAKIQQFIKESVLEKKDINLNKLKEAKDSIDEITSSFEKIEEEISQLEVILNAFEELRRIDSRIKKDDAKNAYKRLLKASKSIEDNKKQIDKNTFEIINLSDLLKQEKLDIDQKNSELINAKLQLEQVDGTKAIQEEKSALKELQNRAENYKTKIDSLRELSSKIRDFLQVIPLEIEMSDLSNADIPSSIKNDQLVSFKEKLNSLKDDLNRRKYEIDDKRKNIESRLLEIDEIIKTCERNLPDYSRVNDQIELIKDINNKFKELNINTEARFSSSLVSELKNEEWRNSIETFLGIHRYSILVEPEYFDIANEVMNNSKYKYVELVNTKLLNKKEFDIVDDSLLYQLEIQNEIAKKYFTYWLGRIHAVNIDEVPNYENAISKEGKISRNMAVSFLNFKKIESFCLGQDAAKLNKERAAKEKLSLETQESEIIVEKDSIQRKISLSDSIYDAVLKDVDLEAPSKNAKNQIEIKECENRIKKLEDALQNNSEYLLLVERINDIETKLGVLNKQSDNNKTSKIRLEQTNTNLLDENNKLEIEYNENKTKLDECVLNSPNEVQMAKEEYDAFVNGEKETGDVLLPSSRDRLESEKRNCERTITNSQTTYNIVKQTDASLPVGLECEPIYQRRKQKLQVDNFEKIKAKLNEQTKKYENIFKNEFVLKIKTNIENAQADIKDINRELRKLNFSTKYQFYVNTITGTSDYARILDYAEYLKKTNRIDDNQMMLGAVVDYSEEEATKRENEIKEIINRVISKNNDEMLNEFADYRNYMEYEVIVNNEEILNGKLSKLAGYNSGAGTQIPYTIILSAALAMIYNVRVLSTRLIFIDEPFEKMSDKNIKVMLDFFKSQNFQVIFCAPPNKLDSIGKECDAVIPVKKISKSNMTLGAIKFHECL